MDDPVVAKLSRQVTRRRRGLCALSPGLVEALDVVSHALVFTGDPRALELWRAAMWDGVVRPETREAILRLLEYARGAIRNGDACEVTAVCDCLHALLKPHTQRGNESTRRSPIRRMP